MRADGSSFPPSLQFFFSPFHRTGGKSLLVHFSGKRIKCGTNIDQGRGTWKIKKRKEEGRKGGVVKKVPSILSGIQWEKKKTPLLFILNSLFLFSFFQP